MNHCTVQNGHTPWRQLTGVVRIPESIRTRLPSLLLRVHFPARDHATT